MPPRCLWTVRVESECMVPRDEKIAKKTLPSAQSGNMPIAMSVLVCHEEGDDSGHLCGHGGIRTTDENPKREKKKILEED